MWYITEGTSIDVVSLRELASSCMKGRPVSDHPHGQKPPTYLLTYPSLLTIRVPYALSLPTFLSDMSMDSLN